MNMKVFDLGLPKRTMDGSNTGPTSVVKEVLDSIPTLLAPEDSGLDVISVSMPKPTNARLAAIQQLPLLKKGAYGQVYAMDNNHVLKVINMRHSGQYEISPLQELAIGSWVHRNNLPFLTPIVDAELLDGYLVLKMPRAVCDLNKLEKKKISPVLFSVDILKGLVILQYENILYADFKPDNILFFSDGSVKITDFGHSRVVNTRKNVHLGVSFYDAPEALDDVAFSKLDVTSQLKYDVWGYAVTIAELVLPAATYKNVTMGNYKRLVDKYKNGINKKYGLDHILSRIIHAGLVIDVNRRYSGLDMIQMVYSSKLIPNLKYFEIKILDGAYYNIDNIDQSIIKEIAEQYDQTESTCNINHMFVCIWNRFNREEEVIDRCYSLAMEVVLDRLAPKHFINCDDHYYLAKRVQFDILNLRSLQVIQSPPQPTPTEIRQSQPTPTEIRQSQSTPMVIGQSQATCQPTPTEIRQSQATCQPTPTEIRQSSTNVSASAPIRDATVPQSTIKPVPQTPAQTSVPTPVSRSPQPG